MFHHRNWFPYVVVGLSILLLLFVAWAYLIKNQTRQVNQQTENQPAITVSDYEQGVKGILMNFWSEYSATSDVAAKLVLVESKEDKILALRVPAEYRAVHLSLASSLEMIRVGLSQADEQKLTSGLDQLNAVFINNGWLGTPRN
ncbi:MAG: hypothetical protein V1664_01290 [Candidatus Uhrbacteria bacterium]